MAGYLFLLAVAGGVAFVIWNYRRKTAARMRVPALINGGSARQDA